MYSLVSISSELLKIHNTQELIDLEQSRRVLCALIYNTLL